MNILNFEDGMDAVFLPGKVHGCENQAYIIYFNADADEGNGCVEIEIVDKERILKIYEEVEADPDKFFGVMPDHFHGEWYYCNKSQKDDYDEWVSDYSNADFILGRDGDLRAEMMFLVNWARGKVCPECGFPIQLEFTIDAEETASKFTERLYSCKDCGSSWITTQQCDEEESPPKRYFFG